MKYIGVLIITIFLASILVIPVGYSHAQVSNENGTLGQRVSNFVHQSISLFKQQREESLNAIKECRKNMTSASAEQRDKIRNDCQSTLKNINKKYQAERQQFQELFTKYRDSVKVMVKEAKGTPLEKKEKELALKHVQDMRENEIKMLEKTMRTKGNVNCINPQNGSKIC